MRRSFRRTLALVFALLIVGVDASAVGATSPGGTEVSWDLHGDFAAADSMDLTAEHSEASIGGQLAPGGTVAAGEARAYDYRSDFERPPPVEAALRGYDNAPTSPDPVEDLGRVRRVSLGLRADRVAPQSGGPPIGELARPSMVNYAGAPIRSFTTATDQTPTNETGDCYYDVALTDGAIVALSFKSFVCTIDPESGKILQREFVK